MPFQAHWAAKRGPKAARAGHRMALLLGLASQVAAIAPCSLAWLVTVAGMGGGLSAIAIPVPGRVRPVHMLAKPSPPAATILDHGRPGPDRGWYLRPLAAYPEPGES